MLGRYSDQTRTRNRFLAVAASAMIMVSSQALAMCCEVLVFSKPDSVPLSVCKASEISEVAYVGEFLITTRSQGETTIETISENPICLANAKFEFVGVGIGPDDNRQPVQYLFAKSKYFNWSSELSNLRSNAYVAEK